MNNKQNRTWMKKVLFLFKGPSVTTQISPRVVQGMRKGTRAVSVSTRAIEMNTPSKNISYGE